MGTTVWGSNPGGVKVFNTRPQRPRSQLGFLYNGYRVPSPEVKRSGRGIDHLLPSGAEVKERSRLYIYPKSSALSRDFTRTLVHFYLISSEQTLGKILIQCVRQVAVQLSYGRVQLKCDGTR